MIKATEQFQAVDANNNVVNCQMEVDSVSIWLDSEDDDDAVVVMNRTQAAELLQWLQSYLQIQTENSKF